MERFERKRFRIKLRESETLVLKSGMKALNGMELVFQALWIIGSESSLYEGEWAMGPAPGELWHEDWPAWIALGDLEAV